MSRNIRRITASLPTEMVADLDLIATSFQVTRSALMTQLLLEATSTLRHICEQHVLPLRNGSGDKKATSRAITETLDRLAVEIQTARGSNAQLQKH